MDYKYRYLQDNLQRKLADIKILLITGPRRSGKSTLAKKLLENWGGGSYFSFDTPQEQYEVKSDIQLFVQNLTFPVVLDEVQNIPEIFPYLKSIVDKSEKGFKIILTGSQNFSIMKNIKESLAGRILIKELLPFTTSEGLEVETDLIKNNFKSLLENQSLLHTNSSTDSLDVDTSILRGGYPPIWDIPNIEHLNDWFDSYCQTYVERDVRSLINIKDLSVYQKFISLVSHRSAKLINYSELGKDISVNYKTSKSYISILKASYLWADLPSYTKNMEQRLFKSAKGIFLDTGLCCHLNGISSVKSLRKSPNYDFLFKTWVITELLKLSKIFNSNIKFFHYRRSDNFEVGCVLEVAGKFIPIEIKNSANIKPDWTKGIQDLASKSKQNYAGFAYIISRYNKEVELAANIKNIPISYLTGVL